MRREILVTRGGVKFQLCFSPRLNPGNGDMHIYTVGLQFGNPFFCPQVRKANEL